MLRLRRRQVVVLFVFGTWALLFAIGLFGGAVVGLPKAVTDPVAAIALVTLFWFMPGGYLVALVMERRRGAVGRKGMAALAIRRRWYFGFASAYTLLIGVALLVPSTAVTGELRIVGAVIFVWGLIALAAAVLAFRTSSWMADANRAL